MTVKETLEKRKSIRQYEPQSVEEEKLTQVLEAARLAPTARNLQDVRIIVVRDADLRRQMVAACCNQPLLAQAPVHLVVCSREKAVMQCSEHVSTVDCCIAMSFMVLQAAELGLGTCWLGAFEADRVKQVLGIPADVEVVAVSPLGYPAEEGRPRTRNPLSESVYTDGWEK